MTTAIAAPDDGMTDRYDDRIEIPLAKTASTKASSARYPVSRGVVPAAYSRQSDTSRTTLVANQKKARPAARSAASGNVGASTAYREEGEFEEGTEWIDGEGFVDGEGYFVEPSYAGGDWWNDPASDTGYSGYHRPRPFRDRLWFRAESLAWWTEAARLPPLVTTSPSSVAWEEAGVLPNATILFGGDRFSFGAQGGSRLTLGYWLDPCHNLAFEIIFTGLSEKSPRFDGSNAILARPFFNIHPATGDAREDAQLINYAGRVNGNVSVLATTKYSAFELLARRGGIRQGNRRFDLLIGYRSSELDDVLRVTESRLVENIPGIVAGTTIDLYDNIDVENRFHGFEFGITGEYRHCRWGLEYFMKLAIGGTSSRAVLSGETVTTVPGDTTVTTPGGLLVQPSNLGSYRSSHVTVIPEIGFTARYCFTQHLRGTFGYTFVYWSQVARPGDLLSLDVNPTQAGGGTLVGPARPEFRWVTDDFWAHGINLGLEYEF